ncbi:protease modulator HflC [Halobacteriovorax sp. DA5]|uniref:protease modulator HflC n=1 Tax=Halobacteriovorax sp. DA5 TaxID=2067553 RepID=UPI000CD2CA32|nr:protease modulator HflC [Halobacteriovorax sp. DA5]POB12419.1 protease modulator HflC [Halobacteriovorax sp. DA5]
MNKALILIVILFIGLVLGKQSLFIVSEGRQAIITEFGKPVGNPITDAGLHFKKPFVQDVRFVDKRILSWDGFPNQIPTKDKKFIKVDTTARFKIIDALKFIQTVRNTEGAKKRIDTILDSSTRNVISSHDLVEAVRNSNAIIEKLNATKVDVNEIEEEITGDIEDVSVGREKLSQLIVSKADGELEQFGIQLIDVQLRRISYEKSVERKVYERMISERQRIAQKIRSIGEGEKAKIEGRLVKDLQTIQSEGYKKSQLIKGRAEAKASAVYAKTFSQDPSFFEFVRSLEAYKTSIKGKTKFIISNDNEFLKYLR